MFFAVSKIFWAVAEPITLAVLVGILGIILGFTRFARLGRVVMAGAIVALAVGLFTPLGALLLRPLEDRFPVPPADMPAPSGIIVLGGVHTEILEARHQFSLGGNPSRLVAGAALVRRYPKARLVFTGGRDNLLREGPTEAAGAKEFWLALGVPDERMMFEDMSRNTWENAVFTRELVKPKKGETWLLVTSAFHMPRSAGIFRHIGFDVIPYPVDYCTFGDERDFRFNLEIEERIAELDSSIHEWVGLLVYWLKGKTDALFPAP